MTLEIWSAGTLLERATGSWSDVESVLRNYYGPQSPDRPLYLWIVLNDGCEVAAGEW